MLNHSKKADFSRPKFTVILRGLFPKLSKGKTMIEEKIFLTVKQERSSIFKFILYYIGILIAGYLFVFFLHIDDLFIIECLGVLFGVICFPVLLIDLIRPKTLLCLKESGFIFHDNVWVNYSEIKKFELVQDEHGNKAICFSLKNEKRINSIRKKIGVWEKFLSIFIEVKHCYDFDQDFLFANSNIDDAFSMFKSLVEKSQEKNVDET